MKKIKNQNGLTLLEVIISLAIVSIMVVPVGNMLRMSISTNKKNDVKQHATLLGQEIIEEIDVLNNMDKNRLKFSNIELKAKDFNSNSNLEYYINDYGKSKLNIEISAKLNADLNYDYNYIDTEKNLDGNFNLETNSQNVQIKDAVNDKFIASFNNTSSEPVKFEIIKEESKVKLIINEDRNNIVILSNDVNINSLKIMMYLTNKYVTNDDLNIDIYNNSGIDLELLVKKSYDSKGDVLIENKFGKLTIYNNIRDKEEIEENKIKDLYNINIKIRDNKNILFEGNLNKNIGIID